MRHKFYILIIGSLLFLTSSLSAEDQFFISPMMIDPVLALRERVESVNTFLKNKSIDYKPVEFKIAKDAKTYHELLKPWDMKSVKEKKSSLDAWIQDTNNALKLIEPFREKAEKIWDRDNSNLKRSFEEGYIYESREKIKTSGIGVILDNSTSMGKQVEKLRKHIQNNFKNSTITEVFGCKLTKTNSGNPWLFIKSVPKNINPFLKIAFPKKLPEGVHSEESFNLSRENMSLIYSYVEFYKIDTLYWFCDLADDIDDTALIELEALLARNKVKLYLHVPKRTRMVKAFQKIINKIGGKLIIKKL